MYALKALYIVVHRGVIHMHNISGFETAIWKQMA